MIERGLIMHNLSQLFSPSVFRKLITEGEDCIISARLNKYVKVDGSQTITNREAIKSAYKILEESYRFEYLYKNALLNKLIAERKHKETTVINELRVGKSIADTIFVNGEPILYEIKTELDKPDKLLNQINDYSKAFAKIYVVTHESIYYNYYRLIKELPVGLMLLNTNNELVVFKEAIHSELFLNHITLFKLLRKDEYSLLLKSKLGFLPDVPNTLYFRECLRLASKIPIGEFYTLVFAELKKRTAVELGFISSNQTPKELKYICHTLDLNAAEYNTLYGFLNRPYKA